MFRFDCLACGTTLSFGPGQFETWCSMCEAPRPLPAKFPKDFAFAPLPADGPLWLGAREASRTQCGTCRAVVLAPEPIERCPYCASGHAAFPATGTPVGVQGWLPPLLDEKAAQASLWTTCTALGVAPQTISFSLVLVPWASMRFETQVHYEGERGDRVYQEDGPDYVDWHPVSGVVEHPILDTGTLCSRGLPPQVARALRTWDWPFAERDVAELPGVAEIYPIEPEALTHFVVPDLDETLHQMVRNDIGGDEQRIHSMDVAYRNHGLRVIWAPVWTGKLAHMDRVFAVNARSGAVVIETFEHAARGEADDLGDAFSQGARDKRMLVFAAVGVGLLLLAAYAFVS